LAAARKSAKAKAAGPKSPMPPAESSDEMWRRRPEERSRAMKGIQLWRDRKNRVLEEIPKTRAMLLPMIEVTIRE